MIAVKVDLVGLLVSAVLLGGRYPHYVILACLVNFAGFCLGAFFLPGGVESIVAAGVFSAAATGAPAALGAKMVLVIVPAFANYAAARLSGGRGLNSAAGFFNLFAFSDSPFSVVNLRFAAAFLLYNLILIYI